MYFDILCVRNDRRCSGLIYLYSVGVVVQQQYPGTGHFFCFHHGFEVCQQAHMFRHVSGKYLYVSRI